jgi:hypothetical protein
MIIKTLLMQGNIRGIYIRIKDAKKGKVNPVILHGDP